MLPDKPLVGYENALHDFNVARRRAALQAIFSKLTGKSIEMLQYDEVRTRLGGIESARRVLKDIPLDSIVGTVSRYNDFTRSLLPLRENDAFRWAQVKVANDDTGLPPIEVYQIGDAYFILDGHHRASVAKENGAKFIQAYVREVFTKVPISPADQPEDVILKSEYADFLKQTHLDELLPDADLRVTAPGEYEKILEHISVHRYFQGIDENRPISYNEALLHWYDQVYLPVVRIIRQRNILRDFPGRTETDMYLWVMEYRYSLEQDLGMKVTAIAAANDLQSRFSPSIQNSFRRFIEKTVDVLTPDELDPGPPPGEWRRQHDESPQEALFNNILMAIPGDEAGWQSMDLAMSIAKRENALLGGLYIVQSGDEISGNQPQSIQRGFKERCEHSHIEGNLAIEAGNVTRTIFKRSSWADLVILRMLYPPPFLSLRRIRSGLRTLIRKCPSPLLVYPPNGSTEINRVLLAYGGDAKADEALFVATYMAKRWNVHLSVITVDRGRPGDNMLANRAGRYLEENQVRDVCFIFEKENPAKAILKHSSLMHSDLILMGAYESGLARELIFGSTVDRVLWETNRPVLICH